ncbi:hypothetical protein NDU88_005246 [Pleurodeles waltl]|uniref:Uncharacterized protein n=1 Tax=Pleurodeles waltl TaxID=8319 RepID=A0AAV7QIA9_PLEWA|nr:hypothetical protein NDU88_005246 [Pleurodeles waltl]
MQDCATFFDRLPRRCTTPEQLPHIPLSHITVLAVRRWRHPPVYRLLVDLSAMEQRDVIVTYRLGRATILELCAQLEPDLMSAIRHPTDGGLVAAVEPVDSEDEEAEEEDIDNRNTVIYQYFQ